MAYFQYDILNTGTGANAGFIKVFYTVSYDPIKNQTTVAFPEPSEYNHRLYGNKGTNCDSRTTITVTAVDGGNTASSNMNISITGNGGYKLYKAQPSPDKVVVQHSDAEGEKNVSISASTTYTYDYTARGSNSVSASVGNYYPASSLTVFEGALGVLQTLMVDRIVDSYTHTITYSCGTESGTICEKSSNTSVPWTPPISLASQNTQGTSVAVQFTITTYTGDSVLGTKTVSIAYAIPETVKPSFTVAVSDAMGYANNFGGYVQTKSKLKIVVDATTMYDATITSVKVTANGETHNASDVTTGALQDSGENLISIEVIDSRGRKTSGNTTVAVLAYLQPAISLLTYNRCDSDGTDNVLGNFVELRFSNEVTSLSGKNAVNYTLEYKKTSALNYSTVSMTDFAGRHSVVNGTKIFAADSGSSYDVRLTVSDSFGSAVATLLVDTGFAIMHWLPRGIGMAIGKIAELPNTLELGWQIHMNGNKIAGLGSPEVDTDGANKKYVDDVDTANKEYLTGYLAEELQKVDAELQGMNDLIESSLSMTLLWENASPDSDFAAQQIAVPAGYSLFLIGIKGGSGVLVREGQSTRCGHMEWNGLKGTRGFDGKSGYIDVLVGATLSGGASNSYCVPLYIYGIKGVS